MNEQASVTICIITYRRPQGLERLLRGLTQMVFSEGRDPRIDLAIVDNDPCGSAEEVCKKLIDELRWPVIVETEARRGIPFARNRALKLVNDASDFVAFIDDDEVPSDRWLDELLRTQELYEADVVTGPVLAHFSGELPAWLERGRFFDRPRYATGTRLRDARTGNVLIRASVIREMGHKFDERLAFTGGSDTHFFRQIDHSGFVTVFANDAIVYEWVPASRANGSWLLRREFRIGNTVTLAEQYTQSTLTTTMVRAIKGTARIAAGICAIPIAILTSGRRTRTNLLRAFMYIGRGAGMVLALLGHRYEEYRRTHGS